MIAAAAPYLNVTGGARGEQRLGVRLLNRTMRRVSATEVGQNYYEHCLRILAELEEADGAAAICKQRRAASLR